MGKGNRRSSEAEPALEISTQIWSRKHCPQIRTYPSILLEKQNMGLDEWHNQSKPGTMGEPPQGCHSLQGRKGMMGNYRQSCSL